MAVERISIELTNRCGKACSFCYNASGPRGETRWSASDVVAFVEDCARQGTRAVSFGGGEPLEHGELPEILERLDGQLFRSVTTNGLLLDEPAGEAMIAARPDKVHVSLHFPERRAELDRVTRQVRELEARGIRSGVNFLVRRSQLEDATRAAATLRDRGIGNERIVYLPMRGADTPFPDEVGIVAGSMRFQSMSCLAQCGKSPRFASIGWDRRVAWCSYTTERRELSSLTALALEEALDGLDIVYCGGRDAA